MIVRLVGTVAAVDADSLIVDTGGVGYLVHVPVSVAAGAGPEGASIVLFTRLRVSDSDMTLYGATDAGAMRLFDQLVSVSGIGPRLAMAMLSSFDTASLANAIVAEDTTLLTQTPGVGPKTAQRVVLELKSKVAEMGFADGAGHMLPGIATADGETVEALMALGYSAAEARRAVAASGASADEPLEERIRASLRWLSG